MKLLIAFGAESAFPFLRFMRGIFSYHATELQQSAARHCAAPKTSTAHTHAFGILVPHTQHADTARAQVLSGPKLCRSLFAPGAMTQTIISRSQSY